MAAHLGSGRCRDGGKKDMQAAIRESIDRRMPCVAFGVFPVPGRCIPAPSSDSGLRSSERRPPGLVLQRFLPCRHQALPMLL